MKVDEGREEPSPLGELYMHTHTDAKKGPSLLDVLVMRHLRIIFHIGALLIATAAVLVIAEQIGEFPRAAGLMVPAAGLYVIGYAIFCRAGWNVLMWGQLLFAVSTVAQVASTFGTDYKLAAAIGTTGLNLMACAMYGVRVRPRHH